MKKLRLVILCLGFAVLGCESRNKLDVSPVHGTVTIDGQPLTSGVVTAWPSSGRASSGKIQSDGTFDLTTYVEGDGAQLGTHPVTVSRAAPKNEQELSASELSAVPDRYSNRETSGLTVTVTADQPNTPVLELRRK